MGDFKPWYENKGDLNIKSDSDLYSNIFSLQTFIITSKIKFFHIKKHAVDCFI